MRSMRLESSNRRLDSISPLPLTLTCLPFCLLGFQFVGDFAERPSRKARTRTGECLPLGRA